MKAVRFAEYGGPEVLRVEEAPDPVADAGWAVVSVRACALNHLDLLLRKGVRAYGTPLPHIPGCDIAGVVKSLGGGNGRFKPGDRVVVAPGLSCGECPACLSGFDNRCPSFGIVGASIPGGCAEKVAVPVRNLFPLPSPLSFEEAAAFPLTFLTAWHMLITRAGLKPGQTVVVTGAGSGIGTAAIQIGKLVGARVIAVSRTEDKLAKAAEIGADAGLLVGEYIAGGVREETDGRGADVIFEHVGPATFDASIKSLAKGGTLVTCGATTGSEAALDLRYTFSRELSVVGSMLGTRSELATVVELVARGRLKPVIDSTLPLDQVRAAQERLEAGESFGKIVLVP
ncbi:MAG: zinc-binding dehydrogenase [Nitrospirota bacterium]|jgi:NADPH:quinone reductase-like Zn-dependent oxidoreductase